MTLLHHLFSNFDSGPDKAASLFRKLNSLHLRHTSTAETEGNANAFRRAGASPMSHRGKMKSARTAGRAAEARLATSAAKLGNSQVSPIFPGHGPTPGLEASELKQVGASRAKTDIKPLELNPVTHYFETPFELAIEHFQNAAVQFALSWNYNQVQSVLHAKQSVHDARSRSAQRQRSSRQRGHVAGSASYNQLKFALTRANEPAPKDFFYAACQSNPRKLSPLHRAVICGNFNGLKLLLDSPLCIEAAELSQALPQELRRWTVIDLSAQDKHGKTPRDYSHKIVFMSKLLNQAMKRHIWRQSDLHSIDTEIRKKRQMVEESKQAKAGVLATYDKLISFQRKSKLLDRRQHISHIFGASLAVVRHTCLNFVFLNSSSGSAHFLEGRVLKRHRHANTLANGQPGDGGPNSARTADRRLVKSFAVLTAESAREQTPFQVKTATGAILTPSLLSQKQQTLQQQLQTSSNAARLQKSSAGSSIAQRQSVPTTLSSKGIKKAKSMAFNSLTNRLDRDSQARQFLSQAMMQQQQSAKKKSKKTKKQSKDSANFGKNSVNSNSVLKISGSQSQLAVLRKQDSQSQQTQLDGIHRGDVRLDARYGQPKSAISNFHEHNTKLPSELYQDESETHNQQVISVDSADNVQLLDNRLCLHPSLQVDSPMKQQSKPVLVLEKSPKKRVKNKLELSSHHLMKDMQRSVKVDTNLNESLFNNAQNPGPSRREDLQAPSSPLNPISGPKMFFKKPGATENQSDALRLADLEVEEMKVGKPVETSVELTHDFDDSGSADSFTPLPSIQNDYALEIKSFNNQWKKPYSQQLSTNVFREQFNLIMDYQCDFNSTFVEEEINIERLKNKAIGTKMLKEGKPLRPHQKLQILYDIVKQAKHPYHKLQDAKDIFDFIQYEIGSQTQAQKKRVRLEAPAVPIEQPEAPSKPEGDQQQTNAAAAQAGSPLEDIVFLRQEVNYLRCQLDLIAKQMVAIPEPSQDASAGYCQTTNQERFSTSNVDTQHVMTEQMTETSVAGTLYSARVNKIQLYRKPEADSQFSLASQQQQTIGDHTDGATPLTEADQEFSDEFDENVNENVQTVHSKGRKQKITKLVQPADMLSKKTQRQNAPPQSSLSRLLKNPHKLQQQVLTSSKRKTIKQLDKDSFVHRSRENLETEEGHTVINQPLISAELQSFSDRLSQHRYTNKSGQLSSSHTISMFKKAKKSLATIKMLQRDKTPPTEQAESADSATRKQSSQPANKLKYAAFAHIDLANLDFKSSSVQGGAPNKHGLPKNDVVEKSRSVIAIPKSHTFSAALHAGDAGGVLRPTTHISQERAGKRSQQYNGGITGILDSQESITIEPAIHTEELKVDSSRRQNMMKIVEGTSTPQGAPGPSKKHSKAASSVLHRADSYKQIGNAASQLHRGSTISNRSQFSIPTSTASKKKAQAGKKQTMSNLAALTSQKISVKALHENQQKQSKVRATNASGGGKAPGTSQQSGAKISHLGQLSAHAIHLPPDKYLAHGQTAKSSAGPQNHQRVLTGGADSRVTQSTTKINHSATQSAHAKASTYVQPKVVRYERQTFKVMQKQATTKQLKNSQPISRNANLPSASSMQITSGTVGRTSLDAVTSGNMAQLKIRPHHRLLKDLMERPNTTKSAKSVIAANKQQYPQ